VCGATTGLNSLKHHIKSCARKALVNLRQCAICRRPIQQYDLAEHQKRCKEQGSKPCDNEIQIESLRIALSKLERGELAACDGQGMFSCAVCGRKFTFGSIVGHQSMCERKLTASSENPLEEAQGDAGSTTLKIELNEEFRAELEALKEEIISSPEISKTGDSSLQLDDWKLCLGRLETICTNATGEKGKDKKYRKLKKSNPAFHAAIGKWTHGVGFMVKIGFQELVHVSKNGEQEEVLLLPEPFTDSTLLAITEMIQAAHSTEKDTMTCSTCKFCERKFRFDRIAKHETRCQSGKPAKKKFDFLSHHLKGTPSEKFVSQIRREGPICKLPPIGGGSRTSGPSDGLTECPRCLRRFNPDSFFKHKKICKGDSRGIKDQLCGRTKSASPEVSIVNGQISSSSCSAFPEKMQYDRRTTESLQYASAGADGVSQQEAATTSTSSGIRGQQRSSRSGTPNRTGAGSSSRPMTPNRTGTMGHGKRSTTTTQGNNGVDNPSSSRPQTPNRTGGQRSMTPNRTTGRMEERPISSRHMSSTANTMSSTGSAPHWASSTRSAPFGALPSTGTYASSSSALVRPNSSSRSMKNNTMNDNYGSGSGVGTKQYTKGTEANTSIGPALDQKVEKSTLPPKVVEAEKFVDYDQMDTVLDSWLDD